MLRLHYCNSFEKKTQGQSYERSFHNKLDELGNRKKLVNSGNLKDYGNGLYVLKTFSPQSRIIIEEKKVNNLSVLFVRDIIINENFDDNYGIVIHPKLKNGEWLKNNPLPLMDYDLFIESIRQIELKINDISIEKPPKYLTNWLDEFRINVKCEIFEFEEWVRYALSDCVANGLKYEDINLFRLVINEIITNDKGVEKVVINEQNGIKIITANHYNVGIIYSYIVNSTNTFFILLGGAHLLRQKDYWDSLICKVESEKVLFEDNIESIRRHAYRAYPKWTLNNDELWLSIEKSREMSNLSLTKEQMDFFNNFKFPYYINGQAGSGKSTMLYYLFANACYYKSSGEIKGEIIFLTENNVLLEYSKKSVLELLTNNPDFELGIEERSQIDANFVSFKDFLIKLVPEEEINLFPKDRYLNFSIFKELYESSYIAKHIISKYSAEESWFTIITYIYGYDSSEKITSKKYLSSVDDKSRIIPKDKFEGIEEFVLPFYEKLITENEYWDKLKIIRYLNENIELIPSHTVVICDEAQDFCRVELRFILKLSEYLKYDLSEIDQVPIVFAGDPNQTVNPTGFREREMTQMLYRELKEIARFDLKTKESVYNPTFNYRSAYPVVSLANFVQYFRKKVLGIQQTFPQETKRPMAENESLKFNIFLNYDTIENDPILRDSLIEKLKFKIFIIPVDTQEKEKYINESSLLSVINKVEVKTSVEAKGAEYQQVVLYGFGDYYTKNFLSLENGDNEDEQFKKRYFFNKLYVGITRAQSELIIIDSPNSQKNFWEILVNNADISDNNWITLNNFRNETIEYNPGSLNSILVSTSETAKQNADKDKKQGIYDENPARLKVAANQYANLGFFAECYECLALSEEIRHNWKKAGDYFLKEELKGKKADSAAQCFFQGRLFGDVLDLGKILNSERQDLRIAVSRMMRGDSLLDTDIKLLNKHTDLLKEILIDIEWRGEFIKRIITDASTPRDFNQKEEVVDILEKIANESDNELWKIIGDIFYELKKYERCVHAWGRIDYTENKEYILSQIQISKNCKDDISKVVWLGKSLEFIIDENQKKLVYVDIIKTYFELPETTIDRPLFYLFVYRSILIQQPDNLIKKVGTTVEKKFENEPESLVEFYESLLIGNSLNNKVAEFVFDRWSYQARELFRKEDNKIEEYLGYVNEKCELFSEITGKQFDVLSDLVIDNISIYPEEIQWNPPKHLSNITIRNFRKFDEINLTNLGKFNLIVGDNNVGKTSLLESLLFTIDGNELFTNFAFAYAERRNLIRLLGPENEEQFLLTKNYIDDFIRRGTESIEYTINQNRLNWNFKLKKLSVFELQKLIPSHTAGIDIDDYFGFISEEEINFIDIPLILKKIKPSESLKVPIMPFGKGFGKDLAQIYSDEIDKKKAMRNIFLDYMKIFIPDIERIIVDTDKGEIEIEEAGFEGTAPLHQYGEGANKLFRILVQLTLQKDNRLMIDEIDAGIHHSRFKQFWKIVLRSAYKNNTQIFATTHNIECVRFFKDILQESEFTSLKEDSRVITLRELPNKKIKSYTRIFDEFKYELDNEFEIRGGVL